MTTKIESSNPDRYWLKPGFGTIFENTDRKDAKDPPRLAFFTLPVSVLENGAETWF